MTDFAELVRGHGDPRAVASATSVHPHKTVRDCQHDAVILSGMIEGIDLMGTERDRFGEAIAAVSIAALERAKALADDLDRAQEMGR